MSTTTTTTTHDRGDRYHGPMEWAQLRCHSMVHGYYQYDCSASVSVIESYEQWFSNDKMTGYSETLNAAPAIASSTSCIEHNIIPSSLNNNNNNNNNVQGRVANPIVWFLAYISRLCYDVSVRLSVRLSVCDGSALRIIANLGFKFRSRFTAHAGASTELFIVQWRDGRDDRREEGRGHLALCWPLPGLLVYTLSIWLLIVSQFCILVYHCLLHKYFIMYCAYELYGFYRHVSGCLCPLSLMVK